MRDSDIPMSSTPSAHINTATKLTLCLGALGVVFGDIGTSPLYTMKECRAHLPSGVDVSSGVLGVLSLIFWALMLIVSLKYLWYVMSADNEGEGGIFALLALIGDRRSASEQSKRGLGFAVIMILIGAALLYGDGVITPAISVLGAAEGLSAITPIFDKYIPLIAVVVLAFLFWAQSKGTKRIGGIFGPVMLVWFVVLGVLGLISIFQHPDVLRALNPMWGLALLHHAPLEVAALLGAVVLSVTGAEALYADMGHFGRRYIAWAWYGIALPGLALNYFGQGAYILAHPTATENPFFMLAPQGIMRLMLTGLSIVAAVIASQALISGAFSLTRQAIQLGYFPRLKITYTNAEHSGQIYVPFVNTLLALGCIFTVALFRSSDNLASAYGVAVTGTMAITTMAFFLVVRRRWHWALWSSVLVCGGFLIVDLAFFGANIPKFAEGGWFPLAIASGVLAVMHTWKSGRNEIFIRVYGNNVTEAELTSIARSHHLVRVPGCAVFMVGSAQGTPIALLHHVKANRCLHRTVLLLSIETREVPTVPESERFTLREIGEGVWRLIGRYGYMESPDVTDLLERSKTQGLAINPSSAAFFFNREMIISGGNAQMWEWQKSLYGVLSRNARPAKDYYRITPSQIVEMGLPVQL